MNTLVKAIRRRLNQILGLFPSKLPTGMSEFESMIDSIIDTYPMPTLDRNSIVFGVAATIVRLGPTAAYRPKAYFALILQAGAAKQVAGEQFTLIKEKQKAAELAAKNQSAEDTANLAVASSGTVR